MAGGLMTLGIGLWTFLRALFTDAAAVALENVALRHQLAVLRTTVPSPEMCSRQRSGAGWRSRGLAGSITSTSAPPDRGGCPPNTRSFASATTPRVVV
jgi:hypothetical protein